MQMGPEARTVSTAAVGDTMQRLAILLMLAAVAACESPVDATGRRPPPPQLLADALDLYGMTADCLALPNTSHRVRWWIVDIVNYDGEEVGGAQDHDDIFIDEARIFSARTWRHESMHHILWRAYGGSDSSHHDSRWPICVSAM